LSFGLKTRDKINAWRANMLILGQTTVFNRNKWLTQQKQVHVVVDKEVVSEI